MAAATATRQRSKIGKGTCASFLPMYSMLLPFSSELPPPRGTGDSASGPFDVESGFRVGMALDMRVDGGFELPGTRITPDSRISLLPILRGRKKGGIRNTATFPFATN